MTTPAAVTHRFQDQVRTEADLRELIGDPSRLVLQKALDHLDAHCRAFIASSPMLFLGTSSADGRCDVSPRGDAAGFVRVLDDRTIAIPDRPGNRRVDSMKNILANPRAALLFVVPGTGETLRVNGVAALVRDEDLLRSLAHQDKVPKVAVVLEVEEAFLHCARAFLRSSLWDPDSWPDPATVTNFAAALKEQASIDDRSVEEIDASLARSYDRLY